MHDRSIAAALKGDAVNADTLVLLAGVYNSFREHGNAVSLLERHIPQVAEHEKTSVIDWIASTLRKDGKVIQAFERARGHLEHEPNPVQQSRLLLSMANSAKELKNSDLEAAMLEKLLSVSPLDKDARFRLAFLYSETDRHDLAAHHYALLLGKVDWPNVENNLAFEYGELGLSATRIEYLERVADNNPLSKANLANRYAEAGFMSVAERLAREVMVGAAGDEKAEARARQALTTLGSTRDSERESTSKLLVQSRGEREFMIRLADGYSAKPINFDERLFSTNHGDMRISYHGGRLRGAGDFTTEMRGLGALLALAPISGAPVRLRRYVLELEGEGSGRSGSFKLTTKSFFLPSTTPDSTTELDGLFCLAESGMEMEMLERESTNKRKIVVARARA